MGVDLVPTGIAQNTVTRARRLRRDMTDGERKLWRDFREFRRLYGIHVRRQAPIGSYVVDFAIHERGIVIEIDGEHHFHPQRMSQDLRRDEWLASQGYKVVRMNTGELADSYDGCVEEVLRELGLLRENEGPPPLTPPHKGESWPNP